MKTYTVFCKHKTGEGTTFIEAVHADTTEAAMLAGRQACADAWGDNYELDDIRCVGVAEGDINILHWED